MDRANGSSLFKGVVIKEQLSSVMGDVQHLQAVLIEYAFLFPSLEQVGDFLFKVDLVAAPQLRAHGPVGPLALVRLRLDAAGFAADDVGSESFVLEASALRVEGDG